MQLLKQQKLKLDKEKKYSPNNQHWKDKTGYDGII